MFAERFPRNGVRTLQAVGQVSRLQLSHTEDLTHWCILLSCIAISVLERCLKLKHSISSIEETRDRALSFFKGSGIHEVVSCCLPHQWRYKSDTWRNRTESPCVVNPRG